jgi:FkbH-like protein
LINKTNQFNLNGHRLEESEWRRRVGLDHSLVVVVSYQDKFGPLGKIGVLLGSQDGGLVRVSHWVMSCRAFSRKLEHHTLDALFQFSRAEEVEFAFEATAKNQPLDQFFRALDMVPDAEGVRRISRAGFLERRGVLPHEVLNLTKVEASK